MINEITFYSEDFLEMIFHSLSKLIPEQQKKVLTSIMIEIEACSSEGTFKKKDWEKYSTNELIDEVLKLTE